MGIICSKFETTDQYIMNTEVTQNVFSDDNGSKMKRRRKLQTTLSQLDQEKSSSEEEFYTKCESPPNAKHDLQREQMVRAFLETNSQFLEKYVVEHVNTTLMEKWIILRLKKEMQDNFAIRSAVNIKKAVLLKFLKKHGTYIEYHANAELNSNDTAYEELTKNDTRILKNSYLGDKFHQDSSTSLLSNTKLLRSTTRKNFASDYEKSLDKIKSEKQINKIRFQEKFSLKSTSEFMLSEEAEFPESDKNANQKLEEKFVENLSITNDDHKKNESLLQHDKTAALKDLFEKLRDKSNMENILWDLSACIASVLNADGFTLYVMDKDKENLCKLDAMDSEIRNDANEKWNIETGSTICTYVAKTKKCCKMSGDFRVPEFPDGHNIKNKNAYHVLMAPIIAHDGEIVGVTGLYRSEEGCKFTINDENTAHSFLLWGCVAIHYTELHNTLVKTNKESEFILSVVKSIFHDMISFDSLLKKIMTHTQSLMQADRASLFLVDQKSRRLIPKIFDVSAEDFDEENCEILDHDIMIPLGIGIAGIVAESGDVLNIEDAYADPRFNREVDQITGYHTKNILCMPIFILGNIIGVMQMVNKKTGRFTKEDEVLFDQFAVYCGLALHHAKLYNKIWRSEQKYKIALEVLSYHNSCDDNEFELLKNEKIRRYVPDLDDFYFTPTILSDLDKIRHTVYMFVDLFGLKRFDKECIFRFCLTIKKNYRPVPYHNWLHGFSVANAMYALLRSNPRAFKPLECLGLFVGCLCHDLDHRGKNNQYLLDTESPLAKIYSTSTLEHHHFNQTVTILQQQGHNIFGTLTVQEYKEVLSNMKHCILATDLMMFFNYKASLKALVDKGIFDWNNSCHRLKMQAIVMTGCDLCASIKPWNLHYETVKIIFEEFYQQGDAELLQGRLPIPMMNRKKHEDQPSLQVGFMKTICIPCYELMEKFIPTTRPMLEGCKKNLQKWEDLSNSEVVVDDEVSNVGISAEGNTRIDELDKLTKVLSTEESEDTRLDKFELARTQSNCDSESAFVLNTTSLSGTIQNEGDIDSNNN